MPDVISHDRLEEAFASHYTRNIDAEDWFVELRFPVDDTEASHIQFQSGLFNFSRLTDEARRTRCLNVIADEGLTVFSTGGIFITTSDTNVHELDAARLTRRMLNEVYGIQEENGVEIIETTADVRVDR